MMRLPFTKLQRDERGAALIELALAAPLFAALVVGMSDLARAYSLKLLLEQAAQRTIENVEQQSSVSTTYNTAITTEATNAMTDAGYATGNTITPDSWAECSSDGGVTWTRTASFTTDCGAGSIMARYVSVRISRTYSPMFTSHSWPGAVTLSGFAEERVQ